MSHNAKHYVKSLKTNKGKSSDIRELWKKKKYPEENIVSIHWQILQLLISWSSQSKKESAIEVGELIVCFLCTI